MMKFISTLVLFLGIIFNTYSQHDEKEDKALEKGIAALEAQDYERAVNYFTSAIKFEPSSYIAYFNRGTAYTELEMFNQAEIDFTKSISLNVDDPRAYRARGDVKYLQGEKSDACEDWGRASAKGDSDSKKIFLENCY